MLFEALNVLHPWRLIGGSVDDNILWRTLDLVHIVKTVVL